MNERIQTLSAKFKETESTHRGAHVLIGIDEIEKFAELIVKECIDIVLKEQDEGIDRHGDYQLALYEVYREIKEHFGVEE